jgi:hypothetical protein
MAVQEAEMSIVRDDEKQRSGHDIEHGASIKAEEFGARA